MDILKLKIIGWRDYSMCFIKPPLCDKVCEGWINGEKLDKRLYFDDDFWSLSPGSKNYLRCMGYTDYIIEVDGATNNDEYWVKRRFEEDDLSMMKPENGYDDSSIEEQLDALIDAVGGRYTCRLKKRSNNIDS